MSMPAALIPSFVYYLIVAGITPGPANLCSLSTAMRYGRKVALRQWRGLVSGFLTITVEAILISYLVGNAFTKYVPYFSYVGAAYIVYLAVHILNDNRRNFAKADATEEIEADSKHKEFMNGVFNEGTFMFGYLVNVTNVKIMMTVLSSISGFALPYSTSFANIALVALCSPIVGPTCNLVWLFAGEKLKTVFEKHRQLMNCLMALSLLWCAFSMVTSIH